MSRTAQYCTFRVDRFLFGIHVQRVQEVLRWQALTRVPLAPPTVQGLINLRGQIVMAIDTDAADVVTATTNSLAVASPVELTAPGSLALTGSAWQSLSVSDEILEEDDELEDLLELIADDVQSQWWQS